MPLPPDDKGSYLRADVEALKAERDRLREFALAVHAGLPYWAPSSELIQAAEKALWPKSK
jgi:hypothetical protein